jgi:hypothetical protein
LLDVTFNKSQRPQRLPWSEVDKLSGTWDLSGFSLTFRLSGDALAL